MKRAEIVAGASGKTQPEEEGRRPRKQEPRRGECLEGGHQCSEALDFLRRDAEFTDWAISLPRLVLRTRTSFAWHLLQTFSIETHGDAMITAALPLPAPFPGCFGGGGPGLSQKRLRTLAQKRLVHLLVLVIDSLYLGRPNDVQKRIIEELYARVVASGYRSEAMSMVPGRSGSELIARLDELENLRSSWMRTFPSEETMEETHVSGWLAQRRRLMLGRRSFPS